MSASPATAHSAPLPLDAGRADLTRLYVQVIKDAALEDEANVPRKKQQHKDCHAICITRCWFFFEAIVRSAAQYLEATKTARCLLQHVHARV